MLVPISITRPKEEAADLIAAVQSKEDSSSAAFALCLKSLSFMEVSIAISFSFQRNKCL